jgi:hypothetical protein
MAKSNPLALGFTWKGRALLGTVLITFIGSYFISGIGLFSLTWLGKFEQKSQNFSRVLHWYDMPSSSQAMSSATSVLPYPNPGSPAAILDYWVIFRSSALIGA